MSSAKIAFLGPDSLCGHDLLRLVSRGSAIIAEMHRLAAHLPPVFLRPNSPQQVRFAKILFDFRYFKTPEMYESRLAKNLDLVDADDEFQEMHAEIMGRFYTLFSSMYKYYQDYNQFIKDLTSGFFISYTVESVLLDVDGKQLMVEALYLWGTMLLLMDQLVPGPARERLIVAYFRYKGEGAVRYVDEVRKLCTSTGFLPGQARPAGYPNEYFNRYPVNVSVVNLVLDHLRSEDVYLQKTVYPAPEHRSAALAQQASMIYVILLFSPDSLAHNKPMMREIVDKHFNDNWVIPLYMGRVVDLSVEWEGQKAAIDALYLDTLTSSNVNRLLKRHRAQFEEVRKEMEELLTEGVLTDQFVVDKVHTVLAVLRKANVALRWAILHRRSRHKKFRDVLQQHLCPKSVLLSFLLSTADLEFRLKKIFHHLLETKQERWGALKAQTAGKMQDLSHYFSGKQVLRTVEADEHLEEWFRTLKEEVLTLDYKDATMAGRKIQQLIKALDNVEQFETIDTSTHIKEFLALARADLNNMVRTVNVRNGLTAVIDTVSDMSYAWECINDYVPEMQRRVQADPSSVVLLRAVFLKLTSVLDVPLVRITQANSPDTVSVAEYYSSEMVAFVRRVLEIVPVSVFHILKDIIALQTRMRELPVKIELQELKDYSQLEARFTLAKTTHQISVFTEGMLQMQSTLLGIIEVDPRAILQDGIRKELVRQISHALHNGLQFDLRTGRKRNPVQNVHTALEAVHKRLGGFRKSFEYIQDYINTYGLKMWQEEFSRIIAFNVEQECNRFRRRKVAAADSLYQSRAIPVPTFAPLDAKSFSFMGRLVESLLFLTDARQTIFANESCSWYGSSGRETAGLKLMSLLSDSIGVSGCVGVDRVVGFRIRRDLQRSLSLVHSQLKAGMNKMLDGLSTALKPHSKLAPTHKIHAEYAQRLRRPMEDFLGLMLRVGQGQLIRRQMARQLQFSCRVESSLLFSTLETLNTAVLNDVRKHHVDPSSAYPDEANPLLPELAKYLQSAGLQDPLCQVYFTTTSLPHMSLWLAIFVVYVMPRFVYDSDFGSLVKKKGSDQLDGQPLVFGMATLLKQLHPSVTQKLLAYLGQYVRTAIYHCFHSSKPTPLGPHVVNALVFIQQLCRVAKVPHRVLDPFIPSYVFDAVDSNTA